MTQKSNPPSSSNGGPATADLASASQGNELVTDVKHAVSDVTEQAKGVVAGAAEQVKKSAESQIQGGKDRAAQGLESVADALRKTRDQLSSNDGAVPGMTDYIGRAADGVHRASSYLKNRDLSQVASDVESFARREPALFLGGAFALGLIGSRFLKSSAPARPANARGYLSTRTPSYDGGRSYAGTGAFGSPPREGATRMHEDFGGRPTLPGRPYADARSAPLRSAGASASSRDTFGGASGSSSRVSSTSGSSSPGSNVLRSDPTNATSSNVGKGATSVPADGSSDGSSGKKELAVRGTGSSGDAEKR